EHPVLGEIGLGLPECADILEFVEDIDATGASVEETQQRTDGEQQFLKLRLRLKKRFPHYWEKGIFEGVSSVREHSTEDE
ncbi:unnamed protein product, partial [Amoebophrya sp. A25]